MPKISFKELVADSAFQSNASSYAKSAIFFSTLTLIGCFFLLSETSLIRYLLIFVIWALFVTSLLVAMPTYLAFCFIVSRMSGHTSFPSGAPNDLFGRVLKVLSSMVLLFGLILSAALTWFVASNFG